MAMRTRSGSAVQTKAFGAALAMPYADSEAMQLHLVEVSSRVRRGPRRAPPRSGWLAYDRSLGRAEEHHPRLPAFARPRAQSSREHLAVPAPELALEPRVRKIGR